MMINSSTKPEMLKLSSKVRYGLLALLELANYYNQGEYLQIDQIVGGQQIPDRYLVQIFISLRRGGIVRSQRGTKGGYSLAKSPEDITLLEIVRCLEGVNPQEQSIPSSSTTLENLLIEEIWQEATQSVIDTFAHYSLKDLCDKRREGRKSNPMYYI